MTEVTMLQVKRMAQGAQAISCCRFKALGVYTNAYVAIANDVNTTCISSIHAPSWGTSATTHLFASIMTMEEREKSEMTPRLKVLYGLGAEGRSPERGEYPLGVITGERDRGGGGEWGGLGERARASFRGIAMKECLRK